MHEIPPNPNSLNRIIENMQFKGLIEIRKPCNFDQALIDIENDLHIQIKFGNQVKISIFSTTPDNWNIYDKFLFTLNRSN